MHSFTSSIPILILLGASALATPIQRGDIVVPCNSAELEILDGRDPCVEFVQFKEGTTTCPISMTRETFGEMLQRCCNAPRAGRLNNGESTIDAIMFGGDNQLNPLTDDEGAKETGTGIQIGEKIDGDESLPSAKAIGGANNNRQRFANGVFRGTENINGGKSLTNDDSREAQDSNGSLLLSADDSLGSSNNRQADGKVQVSNDRQVNGSQNNNILRPAVGDALADGKVQVGNNQVNGNRQGINGQGINGQAANSEASRVEAKERLADGQVGKDVCNIGGVGVANVSGGNN